MNILNYSVLILFSCLTNGLAQDFGYEGLEGPDYWAIRYSECIGKHQSPINIQEHNVEVVDLLPIIYGNFDKKGFFSIENNGNTAKFTLNSLTKPTLTGGPLIERYEFSELHFHWGANDFEGSENTINNIRYPMELHIVFYASSYGSVENATLHPDGLAVLSFLYSICAEENANYTEIINALPEIINVGSKVELEEPLSLEDIIASDKSTYFTYSGSLTTPPCSQVVTWIEYKDTIELASEQIEAFRQLNSRFGKLRRNFRPTQPLYGRKIKMNRDINLQPASMELEDDPFDSTFYSSDLTYYNKFHDKK